MFIIGAIAGIGVLSLPKAVEDTGWIGLFFIFVFIVKSAYTATLIGKCWVMIEDRYPEYRSHVPDPIQLLERKRLAFSADRSLAMDYRKNKVTTNIFLPNFDDLKHGCTSLSVALTEYQLTLNLVTVTNNIFNFGTAVVFMVLAANNVVTLLANYTDVSFCYWLLVLSVILAPMTCLGTPKNFWYIGIGATISTGIACVLIVIQTVMDKHKQPIVHHSETSTLKIFTACGKMVFAVAGHSIFPTIITDMKKKNDFYKSALLGYGIVLLMYLPTALSGYLAYGRDVNVNVLKSLSVGNMAHITEILITVHLLFGFVIFMNPICQQFEAIVGVPEEFTWKRCVVRPIIVLAVLFVSESVPHFGTVLSLVGGSATTLLAYVFPCVFYMKLCRDVNEELKLGPHHVINKEGTLTQKSIEYSPLLDHFTGEDESEGAFECEASEASSPASSRTRISEPM
ncbi:SLC32A [Mytilus edulis]|uniref:SLC32A n=1 Tax=Mytilus edulis TaxID=6550 RepID=A0A8S3SEW6_MYTED|nr:SLC32A [Mytilus edulis]